MKSINPHTGKLVREYTAHDDSRLQQILSTADAAFQSWRKTTFEERAKLMREAGRVLRSRKDELANLMADEMGKILPDGAAEVEKCAGCCDFYAENAEKFLSNVPVKSDAEESHVVFDPIGVVLAVMPWNFPFWQVFRFACPSLMAGNVGVLKHASNVSGCALAIEDIFAKAGFPKGVFSTVLTPGSAVENLIRNPIVKAVTLSIVHSSL